MAVGNTVVPFTRSARGWVILGGRGHSVKMSLTLTVQGVREWDGRVWEGLVWGEGRVNIISII